MCDLGACARVCVCVPTKTNTNTDKGHFFLQLVCKKKKKRGTSKLQACPQNHLTVFYPLYTHPFQCHVLSLNLRIAHLTCNAYLTRKQGQTKQAYLHVFLVIGVVRVLI